MPKGVVSYENCVKAMLWKRFGETDGVFENPGAVYAVAVHEAGHALVMHALRRHKERIWFASIEQRGRTGGMVSRSPLFDDWHEMRSDMLANVAISLASRVAEDMLLGELSNGHGGDGPAATRLAERMVLLGHGNQLSFRQGDDADFHEKVEAILDEAYRLAKDVLTENRDALEALASALESEPTMVGEKVHELLDSYGV